MSYELKTEVSPNGFLNVVSFGVSIQMRDPMLAFGIEEVQASVGDAIAALRLSRRDASLPIGLAAYDVLLRELEKLQAELTIELHKPSK